MTPRAAPRRTRDAALWCASLLLLGASIESASFVFFRRFSARLGLYRAEDHLVRPSEVQALARLHHAELGWLQRYETPFGERPRPAVYGRPSIASFGDSFTYGDEVGDAETWQSVLADSLRADVLNFGMGGYGPDQAYLRYRLEKSRLRTPVVLLGFTTENLKRIMNVYRRFLHPPTGIALTKPRFELRGGRLTLLPNPLRRGEDVARLQDPAYVESLGERDWYGQKGKRLRFPYSRLLLSPEVWLRALGRDQRRDVWRSEEARQLLFAILDEFVEEVRADGRTPVLLLLPVPWVSEDDSGPEAEFPEMSFLPYCHRRRVACADGVGALHRARTGGSSREPLFAPKNHLSAEGNRLMAGEIERVLRQAGLGGEAPSR